MSLKVILKMRMITYYRNFTKELKVNCLNLHIISMSPLQWLSTYLLYWHQLRSSYFLCNLLWFTLPYHYLWLGGIYSITNHTQYLSLKGFMNTWRKSLSFRSNSLKEGKMQILINTTLQLSTISLITFQECTLNIKYKEEFRMMRTCLIHPKRKHGFKNWEISYGKL